MPCCSVRPHDGEPGKTNFCILNLLLSNLQHEKYVIFSYFISPGVSSFLDICPCVVVKTPRNDILTFLVSLDARGHFFTNCFCKSLAIEPHWSVFGHVCVCEPITVARRMEGFNWLGLRCVPIPGTKSRISWTEKKGGLVLKEK